jgi:hypothetical protein
MVQKIFRRDLPYDFEKSENRHLYPDFPFCQTDNTITVRYRTVRLGAPAKFIILHSKIGRRVDFARVRYGTVQSESMRVGIHPESCMRAQLWYIKSPAGNDQYHRFHF